MLLDPALQTLFDKMPELASYPIWDKSPAEARRDFKQFCQFAEPKGVAIGKSEDIKAGETPIRSYTPVAAGGGALPAIVYFHGGGFVMGDLDCYDALCRTLANESGCRVMSVDYRLAPEHKFPAAIEDSFIALKWVEENAPDLFIDPNRLAVAGDSAGGNIAAVVTHLAKANKGTPEIAFQLLIYPATRLGAVAGARSTSTGYFLDAKAIERLHSFYIPNGAKPDNPGLSPLEAKDFSGLPPAYIVTAGFDPLRDDGIAYAEKLKKAGVPVMQVDYPSMIHGFFSMQGLIPLSNQAIAAAAHAVKKALDEAG